MLSTDIYARRNASRALRLKTNEEPHATEQYSQDQFHGSKSKTKLRQTNLTLLTERSYVIDGRYDGLWTRKWNLMTGQRQNV